MRLYATIILLCFIFFSCADEPNYDDAPMSKTEQSPKAKIRFDCATISEVADSVALRTLYFLYRENKVAIDNLPVCREIPRSQWRKLDIPKTAFFASGGKWAGGSAYYYVEEIENELVVSKIIADELDGETGPVTEVYRVKAEK